MRTIVIAGGTGFLGVALTDFFEKKGDKVTILTRSPKAANHQQWDAKTLGPWTDRLEGSDILINLTGKSVDCRYTDINRDTITRSRVDSTRILQQAIEGLKKPPQVWLNASSATIYMHAENTLMTESKGIVGDDFSMNVCKQWERAFFAQNLPKTRKLALRTSIVMGNDGGAFPRLKTITKLGLGGTMGRGQQQMSWIHIDDFCRAVEFVIGQNDLNGKVNVTAPNPMRNRDFMALMRKLMKAPFGMKQPKALLEIGAALIGTETELLLKSRNVYPERLLRHGFSFKYEHFEDAGKALIG